jgi:hypothetical protein
VSIQKELRRTSDESRDLLRQLLAAGSPDDRARLEKALLARCDGLLNGADTLARSVVPAAGPTQREP